MTPDEDEEKKLRSAESPQSGFLGVLERDGEIQWAIEQATQQQVRSTVSAACECWGWCVARAVALTVRILRR